MNKTMEEYDYRKCVSLFGYSAEAHDRSGGVCQLCLAGGNSFDFWRQLTVEHLIGQSQGGYLAQIKELVSEVFPDLNASEVTALAREIHMLNTVSACQFCNSTTSRMKHGVGMEELLKSRNGNREETLEAIRSKTSEILKEKRRLVSWKLSAIRRAFEERIEPGMSGWRNSEENTQ